jgi:hypothetical protein
LIGFRGGFLVAIEIAAKVKQNASTDSEIRTCRLGCRMAVDSSRDSLLSK